MYLFSFVRNFSRRSASFLNSSGGVRLMISVVSFSCEMTVDFQTERGKSYRRQSVLDDGEGCHLLGNK